MVRKLLLACGIVSSLLYVAMNAFIPMLWDAYSLASQTISELSALDAPTRPLWFALGLVYAVLVVAFGQSGCRPAATGPADRGSSDARLASQPPWPPMHLQGAASP
jgi:hypothetical protein